MARTRMILGALTMVLKIRDLRWRSKVDRMLLQSLVILPARLSQARCLKGNHPRRLVFFGEWWGFGTAAGAPSTRRYKPRFNCGYGAYLDIELLAAACSCAF